MNMLEAIGMIVWFLFNCWYSIVCGLFVFAGPYICDKRRDQFVLLFFCILAFVSWGLWLSNFTYTG